MRNRFYSTGKACAAIGLIACPGIASVAIGQSSAAKVLTAPGQTALAKALPSALPAKQPELVVRSVTLPTLPDAMVMLDAAPAGYDVQRPALTNPVPALVVVRSGGLPPGNAICPIFTDRIDLRPLIRHRYRLSGVRLTRYGTSAPPAVANDPLTFSGLDAAGNGVPATAYDAFVTLVVRAQAFSSSPLIPGLPKTCTAGYRLSLTARGPRGVDPVTGEKVPF